MNWTSLPNIPLDINSNNINKIYRREEMLYLGSEFNSETATTRNIFLFTFRMSLSELSVQIPEGVGKLSEIQRRAVSGKLDDFFLRFVY